MMSSSERCKVLKTERKRLTVSIVRLCKIIGLNFEAQRNNSTILNDGLLLGLLLHW